ncbi:MAG: YitT family protein [Bacteroidales bacterium]|nr:YitT family protein [Bacteroidales bacterium]
MLSFNKIVRTVWDYSVISFGTLLYCMAWDSFMIPNNIASGGLTGACTILQFATAGRIPVPYSFVIANSILLLLGSLALGKGFGFKTIYAIALSTVLFKILPNFDFLKSIPGEFLYVDEKVLIPVIGGLLEAVGIGFIFKKGGSTGGTDIIALLINKFWPVSPGQVYLCTDLFIIASILLVPGKTVQDMIYGYISMITFSLMVDYVLLGSKSSVQILVFSQKYSEIADYIINNMDRGVTAINAVGWYTKESKKVLLILVRKSQLPMLSKAIKDIDHNAFVSVSPASGVYGEGFEEIKTGIHRKKKVK